MAKNTTFSPAGHMKALFDQIYDVKFSKHTTLVVVLISMLYTVYRTQHYLATAFSLHGAIAWPTAIFIELLVLAASAFVFVALRHSYIAELKDEDHKRSIYGVVLAIVALIAAFLALLFVAWNDAYALTHQIAPTIIMTLVQFTQMLFIVGFIITADLDERAKLRTQLTDYQTQTAQAKAAQCPYCFKTMRPSNRKRHMNACPAKP